VSRSIFGSRILSEPDFDPRTSVPNIDGEPTFGAPWQAQAFAIVVQLHERGLFTWTEWAQTLSAELASDKSTAADNDRYYRHWLAAAEKIMASKGIVPTGLLKEREEQWHRAAHATPHGEPIELTNDPLNHG